MLKNEIFSLPLHSKRMVLHIFNPEHDLALASNLSNFTAPHAGRQLRADLGFLPALWAREDDYILVENVEQARRTYGRVRARIGGGQRHFVDKSQLSRLPIDVVEPWGWDLAIRSFLLRYGVKSVLTEDEIASVRELSHRKYAVDLLKKIQLSGTTGRSWHVSQMDEIRELLHDYRRIVVKAPWSSSGRGVRFIADEMNSYHEGWIRNVIERQGSIIVESYYNKVRDFGMEFFSDGKGNIKYLGLSLFYTKNGAYTGNVIATEEEKRELMARYVTGHQLDTVSETLCALLGEIFCGRYRGPFGVDMMIVTKEDGDGFLLHPCVEINLRRTMGHVALTIPPFSDGFLRVMQISLTDKYRLRIRKP